MKTLAALAYIAFLISRGVSSKERFASWHMFVRADRCVFDLHTPSGPLNAWDYLPHSALAMNRKGLDFFLFYLRHFRNCSVSGSVVIIEGLESRRFIVENSHVVA
ncbi:MAG TPA: hypothetical protein VMF91_18510 [Bryobacteraceae bacterium]|nr:hypothetical protein [Bryobacteraceae bacterium]